MAKKSLYTIFLLALFLFNVYKLFNNHLSENLYKNISFSCVDKEKCQNSVGEDVAREILMNPPLIERLNKIGRPTNLTSINSTRIVIDNVSYSIPIWQHLLALHSIRSDLFYLVVVLQVRLYKYDKARWSINELKQWLHYLFLSGVEHVLICDHFMFSHEKFEYDVLKYVKLGLVTYLPWNFIRNPMISQAKCYNYFIKKYRKHHFWQMAIDIDEYPFSTIDCDENFLVRFLQSVPDDVGEVSLANYLMLGRGDTSQNMVIKRINRITKGPANALSKPIYRPENVKSAAVHHNHLARGRHWDAPHDRLKMLHYWGARVQEWGPDTTKTLDISHVMDQMKDCWGKRLEISLIAFNESSAFSQSTGP